MSIRDTFVENGDKLTIVIYAKNTSAEYNSIELEGGNKLHIRLSLPDGTFFEKVLHFGRPVAAYGEPLTLERKPIPFSGNPYKIEVPLCKLNPDGSPDRTTWGNLEKPAAQPTIVSSPVAPPKEDKWTQLEKESDEDAGIDALFRKIYADGDENVKRAMLKSFQTSGGTVLSTNWAEVKDTDSATINARKQ